jgi:superfamily II DNA or RNA helicase
MTQLEQISLKKQIEDILTSLEPMLEKVYGKGFKFRSYQKKSIKKMILNDKGQIIHGTGTGKSITAAVTCYVYYILNGKLPNTFLINAHQTILIDQLLEDYYKVFGCAGVKVGYSVLYSKSFSDNYLEELRNELDFPFNYKKVSSTNSPIQILEDINNSQSQNIPHFIFSTYHSANKLEGIEFDIINNDEAHEMVNSQFEELTDILSAKKKFYYTATQKITESIEGIGMNNIVKFGKVLDRLSPKDAIERDIIVAPRMLKAITDIPLNTEDVDISSGRIIYQSLLELEKFEDIPRLLVTAKDTKHIEMIMNSQAISDLINRGYKVFDMSSSRGFYINNQLFTGDKLGFIKEVKSTSETNQPMVLIQIKMADTGINIPSLNAMITFRGLSKLTLQQTYGRIARILAGKKCGWVIIPDISLANKDMKEKIQSFINYLRSIYPDFDPSQDYDPNDFIPSNEMEEVEDLNELETRNRLFGQMIEDLNFEVENEQNMLSRQKRLNSPIKENILPVW